VNPARFSASITIAIALLAGIALPGVAHAKQPFDGAWSVLIVTEKGPCDRAFRYPVRITGGMVGYNGQADFTVSGRVNTRGSITVKVARGDQSASGAGRLAGSAGVGSWRAGECSGTWTAERRD
jgi:hypothetical protein